MLRISVGRDYPFRWHLIALIAVSTVPLLALTVIPTVNYVASERAHLQSYVRDTNADILSALDRDLTAKISILRGLASSPALDTADFDRFDRQARELVGPQGFNISLHTPGGEQVVGTGVARGMPLPRASAAADRKVLNSSQPDISNLFYGSDSGEYLLRVTIPVIRQGEAAYLLSARLTSAYFEELLVSLDVRPPYYAIIADQNALIIATSQHSRELAATPLDGHAEMTGLAGIWSGASRLGDSVFRSYRRSTLSGWIVTTSVEYAALNAPLHRSLWLFLFFFLALTAVVLGAGLFLSRRMSASFDALTRAAKDVGDGRIVALPGTRIREANAIGSALASAAGKIHESAHDLARANEWLEHRVTERTGELSSVVAELKAERESAVEARVAAEAANQAKSQFLASMSHELRTPLNAISGFAQLLSCSEDAIPRDRQIRYTQSILDGSEHLTRIIDDVLDMARIETGQVKLDCEALDCLEIMTEVYRTLEGAARERGITFTADTSANLPSIMADRGRLIQVLLNLGSNAIKYNIESGWVLLAAVPREGMVRFSFRDTGRGIPAAYHDRVFETFDRLGAEQGPVAGTGIGLAISRRLVHAMQGHIGFESREGGGTKFWIDLPVANEGAAMTTKSRGAPVAVPAGSRFSILYVEDRSPNIELMRGIIESLGDAQLIDARTVRDGIGIARSVKPDLVITDIHLPDGTGFDVLQQLRQDPETAHIPIMALTADAMPTNVHNMTRCRFDHILTKPFKIPDLVDILRTTLKAA